MKEDKEMQLLRKYHLLIFKGKFKKAEKVIKEYWLSVYDN